MKFSILEGNGLPKAKMSETININNYSYFTPLHVAINNKNLALVKYIMEQIPLNMR